MTTPSPLLTPPPPSRFVVAWRWALPVAAAIIALALILGVFDTTGRPAFVFLLGLAFGLVGGASFVAFVAAKGREGLASLEDRFGGEGK